MRSDAFRGQVVIVTGASAGIGRALAIQLASLGARVAIAARRVDRLEQVASECRALGGEVLIAPTDVSDEPQCKELVERTVQEFGGLEMLINNAGMAVTSLLEDLPTLDLFRRTMSVNFYGTAYCTYHALAHLKKSRGRIVAVSSVGGIAAAPYNTSYCASKYAMHGFLDSLRMELSGSGVSVTVICPWWVVTEFHEALMDERGVPRGARGRALYTERTMTADRCAGIILRAAYKRRREVLMGPGPVAAWAKVLSPKLLDWLTVKIFLEPVIRRSREGRLFDDGEPG